ncbi:hypothetical protein GP486_007063 [Trichoglossum hirsutum]|uniref:Uncharacterized protein n=1 Tax=Trichoglossum hirsutum TaxID=265104 RepID=A0A9P8ICG3_9PEZI|nr:hypothetical protein GP486_007063 [Trichoglossum hirsutum]
MFKNLRAVLSVGRLPLRTESYISRNAEHYTIQRVRILRPIFTARRLHNRRFNRALLYTGGVAGVWHFALPVILGDEEGEEGEEEGSGHPQEQPRSHAEENKGGVLDPVDISLTSQRSDEDAIFIPLGWTRKCDVKPYKGSDPEWQEFLKLAYDLDRCFKLRRT